MAVGAGFRKAPEEGKVKGWGKEQEIPTFLSAKVLADLSYSSNFSFLPELHGFSSSPIPIPTYPPKEVVKVVERVRENAIAYYQKLLPKAGLLSTVAGRPLREGELKVIAALLAISDVLESYTPGKGFESCREKCQLDCDGVVLLLMDAISQLGVDSYAIFFWHPTRSEGHALLSTTFGLTVDPNIVRFAEGEGLLERALGIVSQLHRYTLSGPTPPKDVGEIVEWGAKLIGFPPPPVEGSGLGWLGQRVFVGDSEKITSLYRSALQTLLSRPTR